MSQSWKTITRESLRQYYCDERMSDQQIGALFGVTRNQVSYKRRLYNITRQSETPVYHEKVVSYLNILGLNRLMQEPDQRHHLHQVLTVPYRQRKNNADCRPIDLTVFGNAMICSIDWNHLDSFDKMYKYLSLLTQAFLGYYGFLLRGAIAIGPAFHDERFVFGPAVAKAQMLEKNVARFPRIIIDMKDLHHGLQACPAQMRKRVKKKFVFSNDGFYFMDGFYYNKQQPRNVMLQRAKNQLDAMMVESRREREKVDWMKSELERYDP